MTKMLNRAKKSINDIEFPDAGEIRSRVMDAVEQALDRLDDVVSDAPSASEASSRLRNSAAVNAASTFVVASIPAAVSALRSRATRTSTSRAARMVPSVVRIHPMIFGVAVLGGAAVGIVIVRTRARKKEEQAIEEQRALDKAKARMEGEGPMPGVYLDTGPSNPPETSSGSAERRFVRNSTN
ncbi:MAG: hypothetical protein ABI200_04945 [Gaiellales bacterium]